MIGFGVPVKGKGGNNFYPLFLSKIFNYSKSSNACMKENHSLNIAKFTLINTIKHTTNFCIYTS